MKKMLWITVLLVFVLMVRGVGAQDPYQSTEIATEWGGERVMLEGYVVPGSMEVKYYLRPSRGFETYEHKAFFFLFKIKETNQVIKVTFPIALGIKGGEWVRIYGIYYSLLNYGAVELNEVIQAHAVVSL